MKNYIAESSREAGRKIFTDDFIAIQDTAKSILKIFDVCDKNFVISGCQITITGTTYRVSGGYVYLNGEICAFAGATGTVSEGMKYTLKKSTTIINDVYSDGVTGKIFENSVAVFSASETNEEVLSSAVRSGAVTAIVNVEDDVTYFPNIASAFFSKYCVVKTSSDGTGSDSDDDYTEVIKAYSIDLGSDCSLSYNSGSQYLSILASSGSGLKIYKNGKIEVIGSSNILQVYTLNATECKVRDIYTDTIHPTAVNSDVEIEKISSTSITSENISATSLSSTNGTVNTLKSGTITNPTSDQPVYIPKLKVDSITSNNANSGLGTSSVPTGIDTGSGSSSRIVLDMMELNSHVVAYSGTVTLVIPANTSSMSLTSEDTDDTEFLFNMQTAFSRGQWIPNNGSVNPLLTGVAGGESVTITINGSQCSTNPGYINLKYTNAGIKSQSSSTITFYVSGIFMLP